MSQEICNGGMNQCSAYIRQNYYIRQIHSDEGEPGQMLPLCLSGRGQNLLPYTQPCLQWFTPAF